MDAKADGLNCNVFAHAILAIAAAKSKVQSARDGRSREKFALELIFESEPVFTCHDFSEGNQNCITCRHVVLGIVESAAELLPEDSVLNTLPRQRARTGSYAGRVAI